MTDELAGNLYEAVKRHCARGDEFSKRRQFDSAIDEYNKAWDILPAPKERWHAATWILAGIGEAAFLGGHADLAERVFRDVMLCPGALGNAFLHLRRGQLLFDAGDLDSAADELMRAYMGGGPELFEVEAPKYLEFLSTRARI